jgi:hypothetical protein
MHVEHEAEAGNEIDKEAMHVEHEAEVEDVVEK